MQPEIDKHSKYKGFPNDVNELTNGLTFVIGVQQHDWALIPTSDICLCDVGMQG